MQETEWKKLNLPSSSTYIEVPIAFTGKPRKDGTATVFTGLLLSCQKVLAIIHTLNKAYKKPARITYEYIAREFGMSKETISNAFKTLIARGIIEAVGRSKYKIIAKYRKKDYVEIDKYMFMYEFEVNGKMKRLTYSRLQTLAFLKRGNENPKAGGVFVSSQARIGKAINLPRTTAGDSVRELAAAGLIRTEKPDNNDLRRRGCSLYTVHPEILAVKHPPRGDGLKDKQTYNADELHKHLMLDTEYKNIIERINVNHKNYSTVSTSAEFGKNIGEIFKELDIEKVNLNTELDRYFKTHHIRKDFFPPKFFESHIQTKF